MPNVFPEGQEKTDLLIYFLQYRRLIAISGTGREIEREKDDNWKTLSNNVRRDFNKTFTPKLLRDAMDFWCELMRVSNQLCFSIFLVL